MRIINYLTLCSFFIILVLFNSCTGYKPIFSSNNLNFEISNHTISGDRRLGNQLYLKIKKNTQKRETKTSPYNFDMYINISKNKDATVKSSTGKILEYNLTLDANFKINDYLTKEELINSKFVYSTSYKVQDKHSDTIKTENIVIENLMDKIYQEILIKLTEITK